MNNKKLMLSLGEIINIQFKNHILNNSFCNIYYLVFIA